MGLMKKSRRVAIISVSVVVVYVAMFFLWPVIHLSAVRWRAYWVLPAVGGIEKVAYLWWFERLPDSNWLVKLRGTSNIWWCRQFTTCEVIDP